MLSDTGMIDAGTVDDPTMIRIVSNWLSRLQIVNGYNFTTGHYLSTHLFSSEFKYYYINKIRQIDSILVSDQNCSLA